MWRESTADALHRTDRHKCSLQSDRPATHRSLRTASDTLPIQTGRTRQDFFRQVCRSRRLESAMSKVTRDVPTIAEVFGGTDGRALACNRCRRNMLRRQERQTPAEQKTACRSPEWRQRRRLVAGRCAKNSVAVATPARGPSERRRQFRHSRGTDAGLRHTGRRPTRRQPRGPIEIGPVGIGPRESAHRRASKAPGRPRSARRLPHAARSRFERRAARQPRSTERSARNVRHQRGAPELPPNVDSRSCERIGTVPRRGG